MSDTFRKAVIARLPLLPPTRAPWAENLAHGRDEEIYEELDEGDSLGELRTASAPLYDLTSRYSHTDSGYHQLPKKLRPTCLLSLPLISSAKLSKFNLLDIPQHSEFTLHLRRFRRKAVYLSVIMEVGLAD